jgi:hypothetical protein
MPRTRTAHQYHRLAADCRRSADAAQTRDRQLWLHLARHWEAIAHVREPNVYPFTMYQHARPAKQEPSPKDRPRFLRASDSGL